MEFKEKERVEAHARRSTHFEYTDWNSAQSLNHYYSRLITIYSYSIYDTRKECDQ